MAKAWAGAAAMRDGPVPVVGVVAPSGTGKTTLIARLVPALTSRGWRVGYLKHSHHDIDLDVPGKDSYRIRESGAAQTLLASPGGWILQTSHAVSGARPALAELVAQFDAALIDLVLVEGFAGTHCPKIEVHRTNRGAPPLYPSDPCVLAVVTDGPLPQRPHPVTLPLDDVQTVAGFIETALREGRFAGGAIHALS